tara:strand:+ start:913 stop:1056 length:144 start_codon:yes stop_codon:yes gene_type:complete
MLILILISTLSALGFLMTMLNFMWLEAAALFATAFLSFALLEIIERT